MSYIAIAQKKNTSNLPVIAARTTHQITTITQTNFVLELIEYDLYHVRRSVDVCKL